MSVLLKHILRNIREYKFRSILIIISLAISTMVLFLNLTIKDDLIAKYTSVLQGAYQKYDISVYYVDPNGVGYFEEKDLNLSEIQSDNVLSYSRTYAVYIKNEENLTINLLGFDRQLMQDTNLCTFEEKSEDYDSESDDQIVVSRKTADKFHWKLDDEITIYTKNGEHKLKITGIAKTQGLFLTEFDNICLVTTKNFTSSCLGNSEGISNVLLDVPEGTDLEVTVKQINESNEDYRAYALVDQKSVKNSLTTVNQLLTIVLCLVIGLNFFIIASITKLIMATRLPVIGTFQCLGATKRKMNFILILENATFGIIGAVVGVILGIIVREPISGIFINMGDALDYIDVSLDFKISYLIISVCFSVGLQIIATLSSIMKASRRSIRDNIFNTINTQARVSRRMTIIGFVLLALSILLYVINKKYEFILSISALITALLGTIFILPILTKYLAKLLCTVFGKVFGGPAVLGMKNISSSKIIRSSITLVTVGLSLILMVYGATTSLSKMFEGIDMPYNIRISRLSDEALEYDYIKKLEGVDHIDFQYYRYIQGKLNNNEARYYVVGTNKYHTGLEGDAELLANLADDEILVDELYANKNNIKLMDDVTLESVSFENGAKTYKVKGYINSAKFNSQRNVFLITETEYNKELGSVPSALEVYTNQDENQVKEMLAKKLAGTGTVVETVADYLEGQKGNSQSILNMVGVILGLSVILAIFGLINNQMIGFIQRKREYAVLYSVSMSRAQLRKMIFFEALGTFLTGGIFAFLISQWLIKLLQAVLMSIGMGYPLELKVVSVLQIGGVVLVILLITTISPIRKISKMNIVNQLKYE